MSLLRFDLDTQRQLLSLSPPLARSPRFTHLLRPFLSRVSNTFLLLFFLSLRSFVRSRCWENRPFLLFLPLFLLSLLFFSVPRCHYRALPATFTRSLNRPNDKRLFRLYSVLVNRTSTWNNRTIIWSETGLRSTRPTAPLSNSRLKQ